MSFGEKLFQLRTERGIYQKAVAEYLEVSVGTISNYENGVHCPDLPTLCKLAGYFHVTTDYLLELTECASSMEKLNVQMADGYTIGKALNTMQDMSQPARRQAIKYLDMVKAYEEMPGKDRSISRRGSRSRARARSLSSRRRRLNI